VKEQELSSPTQPGAATAPVKTVEDRLERIATLACDLLTALQPWEVHGPSVRSAAARLTVALAALPLPTDEKDTRQQDLSSAPEDGAPYASGGGRS
jgi:hypothetical protein